MNGEPEPTGEGGLVKAHLPGNEIAGPFLFTRQTNTDPFQELKHVLKPVMTCIIECNLSLLNFKL